MVHRHSTLSTGWPVYAISFLDNRHFVYAGGGGACRTGVPNMLRATEIQWPSPEPDAAPSLCQSGEITLRSDEDAPMCLAVNPYHAHLVCGINAPAEQMQRPTERGNEHVRVFTYDVQSHPAARAQAEALTTDIRLYMSMASLGITDPEHYQKTVAFSPDGKLLAVASTDGRIQLHRYPSMMPVFSLHLGVVSLGEEVYDTDFSHDGRQLAVTTPTRIVIFSTTPQTVKAATPTFAPRILQVLERPKLGGSVGASFRMGKFGRGPASEVGTKNRLYALINAQAVQGSKKRPSYVMMWNADTWTCMSSCAVSHKPATTMAVSPHGRYVAVGSSDLGITLLRASTLHTLLKISDAHDFPPTCLAFSPNGRMLVSASADSSVRLTVLPTSLLPMLMISDEIIFVAFFVAILLMALLIPHLLHTS